MSDLFLHFPFSPICLEDIRRKLDDNNVNRYRDIQSFVNDVRLIFKNSVLYHNVSLLLSSADNLQSKSDLGFPLFSGNETGLEDH